MPPSPVRSDPPPVVQHRCRRGRPFREEPVRLQLTFLPVDGRMEMAMAGRLDLDSAGAVDTQYDQLIRTGFDEVVLDVTGVTAFDPSGAVALATLWARLRAFGVLCRVRGLHPSFADSPLELLLTLRDTGARMAGGLSPLPPLA